MSRVKKPTFSGEESLTVTVYVYDNSDSLIGEATYTESEIVNLAL